MLALNATANNDGRPAGWGHSLLVRRQIDPPPGKDTELAFYRCAGPAATPVPELIRVAAARWAIEELPDREERNRTRSLPGGYRAWYAHTTLAMLAAYLAATRAQETKKGGPPAGRDMLIPLSSNEIRRLLAALVLALVACITAAITWSNWRRRRQHQARACHYLRRGHRPP